MKTAIVIGYGNDLRSDDAIGQLIANTIKSWDLPNLTSLAVHQLTPELAEPLANTDLAIFVDACINSQFKEVQVQSLLPSELNTINTHISNPRSLLALSQMLYGHSLPAWLVTVPGVNFELGDRISPIAEKGIQIAIFKIRELLHKCNYL
ncbi:hydrogenase maturation protease [Dolichospermum sp. ST_con]|nr:hydrogenase maturation protease [Dolichospermum sp. ST_con]MDD1420004.1 hydrogenase maturation protease [Dolichospermum sp. ST_sed1]MDD1426557.1 hydrogenase maturation protease [Dolichospermum sp. ST_sed9]MDD1433115.1 hydrogenase maturation protease [Dolichospermum sp. ST_sed6]MDD1437934.1 hydrogenase maturation protease [Dolichospermum sp. ST_sed10]MDD1442483.1 hydrogenase maturation protease [Dolichospermum sp. ST_sed3]MDD1448135.1 hydrogenase maturation protease [Dolichospermum sp. ST_s